MLYAAPVWAFGSLRNKNLVNGQQRRIALRIVRAYRTVSAQAAMILAELPPVDLLAVKRSRVAASLRAETGTTRKLEISRFERRTTQAEWNVRWQTTEKASWTRKLIPDLDIIWLNRLLRLPATVAFKLTCSGWEGSQAQNACYVATQKTRRNTRLFNVHFGKKKGGNSRVS